LQQWFFGELLRHRFRGFQILARRSGEPEPVLRLSLWDTVKIGWLVTWRAVVMDAGLGALVGFVYHGGPLGVLSPLPREAQQWIQGLSWTQALFITMPWAIKVIVARPPHGFEIGIRRTSTAAMSVSA
jgi:hypothetical protein